MYICIYIYIYLQEAFVEDVEPICLAFHNSKIHIKALSQVSQHEIRLPPVHDGLDPNPQITSYACIMTV